MTTIRPVGPDGEPWDWDDPDLPVNVFLTWWRQVRSTSRKTDLDLRKHWMHGIRLDSNGHLHHYPRNTKSWADAMGGVTTWQVSIDDILALLGDMETAIRNGAVDGESGVKALHERLVIQVKLLAEELGSKEKSS